MTGGDRKAARYMGPARAAIAGATSAQPRGCRRPSPRRGGQLGGTPAGAARLRRLHFASHPYDPFLAYGRSKTAFALFAVEAARRWAEDGIGVNAGHPGAVMETNLARHLDPGVLTVAIETAGYEYKTRERGAATSVLVAASPLLAGISGRYFADCNQAPVVDSIFTGPPAASASHGYAVDPDKARRVWDLSLDLLG
jgi:NAD(P)-dependent dehydrogenase (short-subunit alcohol dehydrogenase family)